MNIAPDLAARFTPTGRLRAAINLGNPILAHCDAQSGRVGGVSVGLALELARLLGVEPELGAFDAAGKSVEAVTQQQADIGFSAAQHADVAAGVKQQLQADARRLGGLRLLDGRFMVIQQAMGTPKGRDEAAAACLAGFVEQMTADGVVAAALARHGIQGASVAPPAGSAA